MVDPPEPGTWGVMRGAREMGQMGRAGEKTCFFGGRGGSRLASSMSMPCRDWCDLYKSVPNESEEACFDCLLACDGDHVRVLLIQ